MTATSTTPRAAGDHRAADPLARSLVVDAVISGGTGVLLAAGSGVLDAVLGIPSGAGVTHLTGAPRHVEHFAA